MYFIAPGIRVFMRDRLKVLSITLLQIFLICSSPLMFAQVPDIVPAPDGGAGGDSGNDIVDCIFKDGFEACLAYIEGFPDTDEDGFGDSTSESTSFCNNIWPGFVDNNRDCNDSSDAMFPGNAESCDGVDNDCDPASADGSEDPLIAQTCDGPDSDLCVEGTYSCVSGALACSDNSSSTTDVCDGVDNDCDPASADGSEDPDVGMACTTGQPGVCSEGTINCTDGALMCVADVQPGPEVCDGLDNDCDGDIDEGCGDLVVMGSDRSNRLKTLEYYVN